MEMEDTPPKQWYVIHTYSGFENKVKASIEQRAVAGGLKDQLEEVLIPTEEVMELKKGKRRVASGKNFRATCWSRWPYRTSSGTWCATPPR